MIELLKEIPLLFAYFVPGYFAQSIINRLTLKSVAHDSKGKPESIVLIPSIAISYLTTNIALMLYPDGNNTIIALVSVLLALCFAFLFYILWHLTWFNKFFIKLTQTTIHHSIWDDVLGRNVGKRIRFYTKFNHMNASVEGIVKYYEVQSDGECRIALNMYTITYGEKVEKYKSIENSLLVIITGDIGCIEVFNTK